MMCIRPGEVNIAFCCHLSRSARMCEDGRNAFKIIFGIVWVFQYSLDGTACLGVPGIALFGLKTYGTAYRGFIWPVADGLSDCACMLCCTVRRTENLFGRLRWPQRLRMYKMLHGTAYREFILQVAVALAIALV